MTHVRMDRHGNVTVPRQREGRKQRKPWLRREVDRWRAGLLTDEGLAEALLSELGWKYDPDLEWVFTLGGEKSHVPQRVRVKCPVGTCVGMEADVYEDHKGLHVCVACGATFDPSVER